jgi:hypothetical protein
MIPELGNGVSHSTLALLRGGYFAGVATAPPLRFSRVGWLLFRFVRREGVFNSDWSLLATGGLALSFLGAEFSSSSILCWKYAFNTTGRLSPASNAEAPPLRNASEGDPLRRLTGSSPLTAAQRFYPFCPRGYPFR